jgi:hypothetical protein
MIGETCTKPVVTVSPASTVLEVADALDDS